jgi:hypothetical protein
VGGLARRDFVKLAAVAAPGALFSACGGEDDSPPLTPAEIDVRILNRILGYEHAMGAAYAAGLPLLRGAVRSRARLFLEQEREHVRALRTAVGDLGGVPAVARTMEEYRRSFPALHDGADVLRFAIDLENRVVRAYVEVSGDIADREVRQRVGSILTCDAEHVAMLRAAAGRAPVPDAFVTGTAQVRP